MSSAPAVRFLASDAASFVTGAVLGVDGGVGDAYAAMTLRAATDRRVVVTRPRRSGSIANRASAGSSPEEAATLTSTDCRSRSQLPGQGVRSLRSGQPAHRATHRPLRAADGGRRRARGLRRRRGLDVSRTPAASHSVATGIGGAPHVDVASVTHLFRTALIAMEPQWGFTTPSTWPGTSMSLGSPPCRRFMHGHRLALSFPRHRPRGPCTSLQRRDATDRPGTEGPDHGGAAVSARSRCANHAPERRRRRPAVRPRARWLRRRRAAWSLGSSRPARAGTWRTDLRRGHGLRAVVGMRGT